MAKLTGTVVNGDLRVTGDLNGTGQYFIVDVTDVGAFSKILDAYNAGKLILLHVYNSSTGIHLWVPMTRVNDTSSGRMFIFSKPMAYGSNIGMMEIWSIGITSTTGFSYQAINTKIVDYADRAAYATSADSATTCTGTATSCTECIGNSAYAQTATADWNGNVISTTYAPRASAVDVKNWMYVDLEGNYKKCNSSGSLLDSGTVTIGDSHAIEYAMYTACSGSNVATNVYMNANSLGNREQVIIPGRVGNGYQMKDNVVYSVDVVNSGSASVPVKVGAGGCWGTTKYTGTVYYNGSVQAINTSDIASWTSGKRNLVTIYNLPSGGHVAFELFFLKSTMTISGVTYQNHVVVVNTLYTGTT